MTSHLPSGTAPRQSGTSEAYSEGHNADASNKQPKSFRFASCLAALRWALALGACLWVSGCTALGPIYWQYYSNPNAATLTSFSWDNALLFVQTFIISLFVVVELVRFGRGQRLFPSWITRLIGNLTHLVSQCLPGLRMTSNDGTNKWLKTVWVMTKRGFSRVAACSRWTVLHLTDRCWKIMLFLIVGWLWVPTTLIAAFGADIHNQFREFSWAWNQWTGLKQPYISFFSFVPMDIYPTAHYLWPSHPVYLTDQHNIMLTLIYGGVGTVSRYFTGSNDWGLVVLASSQFLFAAFCVATTANRFFNRPWLDCPETRTPEIIETSKTGDRQTRYMQSISAESTVGPLPRFAILLFFLLCPLVLFSTISLTKSPLFAFAFVWWFGIGYELLSTAKNTKKGTYAQQTTPARKRTAIGLFLSTLVMMISAKYAMYIIICEALLAILWDRKRWKTYVASMVFPLVLFEGGLGLAIHNGVIINGDLIESHGVQLQQIARIAVLNPDGIPQDARDKLAPIFNLDQMAEAYSQQDADPVKSSGIQAKKVSYRWRTVTKEDMKGFNAAWLEIVKANPRIAIDALISKSYGYFDIQDQPYIDMTYYVAYAQNPNFTDWISGWCGGWRKQVTDFVKSWSSKSIAGWLIHGNTYVIATLLIGAAEVVLRRWRTLATHMPLLLLMGVMVTAPANNFERHMLPLVFVLGFVLLTFWLQSKSTD